MLKLSSRKDAVRASKFKTALVIETMKNSSVAKNVVNVNAQRQPYVRKISGTQFKAVQAAVAKVMSDEAPESTTRAIVNSTVLGVALGTRSEFLLQVESERMLDARHVEVKLVDGANRRYIWIGTTGDAARLQTGNVVHLKGTVEKHTTGGTLLKHCRVLEVAR